MDQKSRLLPHLNVYFLQRKAYEQHRKKIELIRSSITRSRNKHTHKEEQDAGQDGAEEAPKEVKPPIKYSMHTIKEEIKNELNGRLSPWAKRLRQQAQKQNNRLHNRIQNWYPSPELSSSTINRKEIQNHRKKNEEIKQRLSKFIYSPYSHKTLLKCKHSLQILRQKERRRDEESLASAGPSRLRYTKSELSQIQRHGSSERLSLHSQQPLQKKGSLDRFYLLRNQSKIKSHFDKERERRPILSFSSGKTTLDGDLTRPRRRSTQMSGNRNKCFTTQVEQE